MKKSAAMRKAEKAIKAARHEYIGRKVLYIPAGTTAEYQAEILDMSYNFATIASDGTEGDWYVFIRYQTLAGMMTGNRTLGELIPVGWTA